MQEQIVVPFGKLKWTLKASIFILTKAQRKFALCHSVYFHSGVLKVPAGSETMTWILWIGPFISEKKHKGISIVMVWDVAITAPTLFRATTGFLEGISGAEMKPSTEKMSGESSCRNLHWL